MSKEDKNRYYFSLVYIGYCWVVVSKSNKVIWDWFYTKKQAEEAIKELN
jgi:hypothetical protein